MAVGCGLLLAGFSAEAQLRISEFMAANTRTFPDENRSYEDWIEIQNTSTTNVSLLNWSLTDSRNNPAQWRFPSTNLPPGGFLVVFASNKDRRTPGMPLHTNFKLDASGEYLALVNPAGEIATEFSPKYPPQVSDVSYGFSPTSTNCGFIPAGAAVKVLVPSAVNGGSMLDYTWTGAGTNEPFDDGAWRSGTLGAGFTDGSGGVLPGDIALDIGSSLLNSNASAFLRIPFVVNDPTNYSLLLLQIRCNDGFVAWINGIQVGSGNAPMETLDWDSAATATNSGSVTNVIQIGNAGMCLREGTNILAIQGLNISSNDPSFLIAAELSASTVPMETGAGFYFTTPTPGAENIGGATRPGPGITGVGHTPAVPLDNDNLNVTARVFQTLNPVAVVTLRYRIMFSGEISIPMYDDGAHGDGGSGDGVYGATIPAGASAPGQMIRYYIVARDVATNISRWPLYRDPAGSAQYLGTIVATNVISKLPVFDLFIIPGSQSLADSQSGTRASFFYDGEFYDNIGIEVRGNTSASMNKKSHRLEFNKEHPFRHPGPGGRIRKTSLLAEYGDPSYLRSYLSYWMHAQAGVPAAFDYPVHLRLNGAFYQLSFHNDVLGEEMLERLGYDPDGALYKAVGSIQTSHYSLGGFQKLLPKTNGVLFASTADFDAMAGAISSTLAAGTRKINLFDIMNMPEIINYLAVARLCHEGDDVWANMSVHRDTYGSQEWSIVPFDLNMSWGQLYYGDNTSQYGHINATDDYYKSHPLYGGSQVQDPSGRPFNRIYDAVISVPETRQMLLRRMRTLMDTLFQPEGTPYEQDILLQHITTVTNLIWNEARMDRVKWGWQPVTSGGFYGYGPNQWLTNGVRDLINQYINPRRTHFFYTHCVVNTSSPVGLGNWYNAGIPLPQPESPVVSIHGFDYNPSSGNQDQEYVALTNANPYAVDVSGWKLQGGIEFTFRPGTVMASNSALFVSPNVRAFRSRTVSPRGGQGCFVQGSYKGHLNAWGESLTLTDAAGRLVSSNSYAGSPSLAQRFLRITEIMYNPSPAPAITNDAQQFEYIEIKNISTNVTLSLAGVRFTNGILFNFTGSAVTSLAPGQTTLLVRNRAAFEARYGAGLPVAGEFASVLDNGSETLRLEDSVGEAILEFAYNAHWYPITDGLGFSLVIVDENAPWNTWGQKASWRASASLDGSPAVTDPVPQTTAPVFINEVLTHTDLPELDSIELFNPTTNTVNIGGWFLTDDFYTPKKYRIPTGTTIAPRGYLVFTEHQFNTGTNAFRFSEYGESAYLFPGDAETNLSGGVQGFDFEAAPNGVSFGCYTNSQTNVFFTLMRSVTLGTHNSYPRVGPVVVSEIMYRPPDSTNGTDNDQDEFVELQNITATNVALFCTFTNETGFGVTAATNTWRLRNAVDFDFPTNQFLAAGARLLVVGFNPTNTTLLAAFRSKYSVSDSVAVYGPWSGKLDNSEETIELKQPDKPDMGTTNIVPYIMIDKVHYQDHAPWPAGADGVGNSIQRLSATGFGNDPTNWFAGGITAGRENIPNTAPAIALVSPTNGAVFPYGVNPVLSVSVSDPDGSIASVRYLEGDSTVALVTNAPFDFTWVVPPSGPHAIRAVAIDNLGGIALSGTNKFTVEDPPVLSFSPEYGYVTEGNSGFSDMVFTVTLTPAAVLAVTARFATANVTASSGTDYIQTNGTVTFLPGETSKTLVVRVLGDEILEYDETFSLTLSNPTNCQIGVAAATGYIFNDDLSPVDYFTEVFDSSTNDLAYQSFTFTPDGSTNFYSVCHQPATAFPTDAGGVSVSPGDDGFTQVTLPAASSISLYGRRTNVFFIGSNGYLTLASGDSSLSSSRDTHFRLPRVTALLNDLNPAQGGSITWRVVSNRVAVTYSAVPHYGSPAEVNSFQIEMFFDGRIRLTYLALKTMDGLVGLSAGLGTPPGMVESDFSAYDICLQAPVIQSQPANATVPIETNVTFRVGATGYPVPGYYQWYFNSNSLPDGVQTSLTISNTDLIHAGTYFVVVSNSVGVVTSRVAILNVYLPDTDGDGMPDRWERANGTDPGVPDASADTDGDGLSNRDEFLAGTSPTNASSVLKLECVATSGTNWFFSFDAISNRAYSVLSKNPALDTDWQAWKQIPPAPSNRVIWITNDMDLHTNRFFRLGLQIAP